MERRLGRLEALWQADPRTISEASYSIEWAVKWPRMGLRHEEPDRDPVAVADRIRETHRMDDGGMRHAIAALYVQWGVSRREAQMVADLGLEQLLTIAATSEAA
jgi:hypothetical protein